MKKVAAIPSLTDQLKGSLGDIQEGSVRNLPAERPLPVVRELGVEDIRTARNSLNMTQSEFAELLQVATKTVQAWETGRRSPSPGQARWIGMFTSPEWHDRLRKPAPHPRAPHKKEKTVTAKEEVETIGPRRRLGGRSKTNEPSSVKQLASDARSRPPAVTERLKKTR